VDAAVLSAALINKCPPKPRPKHYTDAVWEPTGIVVSGSIVNSAVKKLSADLAFMSAINAELSRLTQQSHLQQRCHGFAFWLYALKQVHQEIDGR